MGPGVRKGLRVGCQLQDLEDKEEGALGSSWEEGTASAKALRQARLTEGSGVSGGELGSGLLRTGVILGALGRF